MKKAIYLLGPVLFASAAAWAEADAEASADSKPADMSDPLAVYTQVGGGVTNKGLNLKVGQAYDTGKASTMGMNIFEVKGFVGDAFGWDGGDERDNSIDSVRFRNFQVDMTKGLGSQIDASWDFDSGVGAGSYSLMQALPKMGRLQLYPLMGAGVVVADGRINEPDSSDTYGFTVPGAFALAGMYTKFTVTDKIWINYNPMYAHGLGGQISDESGLAHEFAISYQLNPRQNIRFFSNWSDDTKFTEGDFRLEFNHQL